MYRNTNVTTLVKTGGFDRIQVVDNCGLGQALGVGLSSLEPTHDIRDRNKIQIGSMIVLTQQRQQQRSFVAGSIVPTSTDKPAQQRRTGTRLWTRIVGAEESGAGSELIWSSQTPRGIVTVQEKETAW
jgi:hypothetical protein